MNEKIKQLKDMIADSKNIVFFGGAGVSTESGVPDFRSSNGVFKAIKEFGLQPEYILSHSFYKDDPENFFKFVFKFMVYPNVKPNVTHKVLAKLEEDGKLKAIVTQNIDGLHQAAGSKNVYELHGSFARSYCQDCNKLHSFEEFTDPKRKHEGSNIPRCDCGGILKPDIILYEELLDEKIIYNSIEAIKKADMLIIGGTSLNVYPAAELTWDFIGKYLVLINKDEIPSDNRANLVIHDKLGNVFQELMQ